MYEENGDEDQPLTDSKEGMPFRVGVVFLSEACLTISLFPSFEEEEEGLVKALMGLAKAQPQLLLRPWTSCPSAEDETQ